MSCFGTLVSPVLGSIYIREWGLGGRLREKFARSTGAFECNVIWPGVRIGWGPPNLNKELLLCVLDSEGPLMATMVGVLECIRPSKACLNLRRIRIRIRDALLHGHY